ncbi:MAG: PAP2 superfamily protein [Candidatus Methanoperedens nitroreducens]|uniref:PAP2 superfamily protein n=1 Tax=Candidatus Methanoperedens nitratireducens TaxID=1392998 RepID=A0A0P8AFT2_9EURY|nr:phosphatase PAP2 family protein [Candidatus Methanoperedens sp. BLZ2]KAB2945080.1 MAG: phosphatase PAP2 family protein [Candidatus Methanoperedens sp.]KPQ43171.1 MAG: PAP2 superfamily protein [Candidatus Methanoperedens sp. BLZ1]MBZ0177024.1 phosphatase PAP2 family protein [Candidatus Methanoperedens nitroreducens]CAG0948879.1 Phosphatidylglycerophosphatase B [Methanosarcinales archaeon]MCX9078205.1 phosphatase PAP2 family protein [Candidatus Methanoperedens sp.]
MASGPIQFLFNENINIFFRDIGTPLLDTLFKVITNAGSEPVYIFLASLIFWCLNKKTGIRAMYLIMFSAYTALIAKSLFSMPRPPDYLHKVTENNFGFPSGHAQVSSGFWGYLGIRSKKKQIIITGAVIVLLVSLSRLYLGVHYPGDVIGGIIFGLMVAFISYREEADILKVINKQSRNSKYLIALFLPLILILIATFQGSLLKEQIELGFVMASVGAGYLLEEEIIRFPDAKNNEQKVKRASIGILFLGSIYLISEILSLTFPVFAYIKYAALGFSSVFFVPWVFMKLEGAKY